MSDRIVYLSECASALRMASLAWTRAKREPCRALWALLIEAILICASSSSKRDLILLVSLMRFSARLPIVVSEASSSAPSAVIAEVGCGNELLNDGIGVPSRGGSTKLSLRSSAANTLDLRAVRDEDTAARLIEVRLGTCVAEQNRVSGNQHVRKIQNIPSVASS